MVARFISRITSMPMAHTAQTATADQLRNEIGIARWLVIVWGLTCALIIGALAGAETHLILRVASRQG